MKPIAKKSVMICRGVNLPPAGRGPREAKPISFPQGKETVFDAKERLYALCRIGESKGGSQVAAKAVTRSCWPRIPLPLDRTSDERRTALTPAARRSSDRQRRERSEAFPRSAMRRNVSDCGALFSFLHRARHVLSFRASSEKKEWGAHCAGKSRISFRRNCYARHFQRFLKFTDRGLTIVVSCAMVQSGYICSLP